MTSVYPCFWSLLVVTMLPDTFCTFSQFCVFHVPCVTQVNTIFKEDQQTFWMYECNQITVRTAKCTCWWFYKLYVSVLDLEQQTVLHTYTTTQLTLRNTTFSSVIIVITLRDGVVRCSAVGWGTALQARRSRVRSTMVSLEFFIDIILPAALCSWGQLSL